MNPTVLSMKSNLHQILYAGMFFLHAALRSECLNQRATTLITTNMINKAPTFLRRKYNVSSEHAFTACVFKQQELNVTCF